MHYSCIYTSDISDGPNTRVGLYVQGCCHKCKNCFNPETWDILGGKEFTEEIKNSILELMSKDHIKGLSILGGDPLSLFDTSFLLDNLLNYSFAYPLVELVEECKERFPNKPIWVWTGYVWENLISSINYKQNENLRKFLDKVDVIVDGPFIEEFKTEKLKYRGSSNQRIIDVQKSLKENKTILY